MNTVREVGYAATWAPALSPPGNRSAPGSFAEILDAYGFSDQVTLLRQTLRWIELFDAWDIDLVLLDYAPSAQMAAHVVGLRAAQITNGFDAPPASCPRFNVRLRGPYVEKRHARTLKAISTAIESVGRAIAGAGQWSLHTLLVHPTRWFDCIAESDPYGSEDQSARASTYLGPQGQPLDAVRRDWPASAGRRILAYLRGHAMPVSILDALADRGDSVLCAWPDASEPLVQHYAGPRMRVVRAPMRLDAVLPEADLVVNYGSTGFVCQTLLAGKPQLMLPCDTEKLLVSRRVCASGAGSMLRSHLVSDVHAALDDALGTASCAQAIAAKYANVHWPARRASAVAELLFGVADERGSRSAPAPIGRPVAGVTPI